MSLAEYLLFPPVGDAGGEVAEAVSAAFAVAGRLESDADVMVCNVDVLLLVDLGMELVVCGTFTTGFEGGEFEVLMPTDRD